MRYILRHPLEVWSCKRKVGLSWRGAAALCQL